MTKMAGEPLRGFAGEALTMPLDVGDTEGFLEAIHAACQGCEPVDQRVIDRFVLRFGYELTQRGLLTAGFQARLIELDKKGPDS